MQISEEQGKIQGKWQIGSKNDAETINKPSIHTGF
jgi:hypothetical protein